MKSKFNGKNFESQIYFKLGAFNNLTSLLQTRNKFAVPLYPKAPNQQHTCSLN